MDLAVRTILGESIEDLGYGKDLYITESPMTAIKAPVFSFTKLVDVDPVLGPEMKSTGEVLGLGRSDPEAMFKALLASGLRFPEKGSSFVFMLRDEDSLELIPLAE